MTASERPAIESCLRGEDLRQWYWRKTELVDYARSLALPTTGAKFELLERIAHFLDTGETLRPRRRAVTSRFDWSRAQLTPQTVITDSYRNTQNVRRFFQGHCGAGFTFSIAFMEWMRENVGKTLLDACDAYRALRAAASQAVHRTSIKAHNQFNQYMRDFLDDNPELGVDDVRRVWALKTQTASANGRHTYEPADLELS